MKKFLLLLSCLFMVFGLVYGEEDIQVTLEQPAISRAKSGESLKYNLVVKLPDDYKNKYESFSVTVLMDGNLSLDGTDLEGAEMTAGKIEVKSTEVSNTSQNIVTLNVNDLDLVKNKTLNLEIKTKVKEEIKSSQNLKNSFVLSYVDKKGKTSSAQKDLESSTKAQNGSLNIDDVYANSKKITGKTEADATIILYMDSKEISKGKADSKGNFCLNIDPIKAGESIRIYSFFGKESLYLDYIVKDAEDSIKTKEIKKDDGDEIVNAIGKLGKLNDFTNFAKNLPNVNASKEESARLKAAIANAEYIVVKKSVKDEEIDKALKEIQESVKLVRKAYMVGSNGNFKPNKAMKRAEVAQVLSKIILGNKEFKDFSSFKDVEEEKWYAQAVACVESKGLMSGYENRTFKPEKEITRAEFAMVIYNYLNPDDKNKNFNFKDVPNDFWAAKAINVLAANEIMVGRNKNEFNPNAKLKRCEAAVIINKILGRKVDEEFLNKYSKNPYKDIDKNHWAYYQVLEVGGI